MGIEPFLVGSSVRAFIAQRLVRVLCSRCKQPGEYSWEYFRKVGFAPDKDHVPYTAVGCHACRNTGYQGRAAIYEICMVSPRIQDMIVAGKAASALRAASVEEGMVPLRLYGWTKVYEGVTTIEEVARVTAAELEMAEG